MLILVSWGIIILATLEVINSVNPNIKGNLAIQNLHNEM